MYLDVLAAPDLPLLYECPSAGVRKHTLIYVCNTQSSTWMYACNTHSMFAVPEGCSVSLCIHSGPRGHYSNLKSFLPFALANSSSVYK